MLGGPKFMYDPPNRTVVNRIALHWTVCSQIKACTTKSCEICTLLKYYAAQSGNTVLTLQDKLLVPASRVFEHSTQKLTDTIFF